MHENDLKSAVERIQMPEEMCTRIIRNCQACLENDAAAVHQASKTSAQGGQGGIDMKKRTLHSKGKIIAAAAAVCLCLVMGVSAAGIRGYYKNITNWTGAVTGGVYEQADGEIQVSASAAEREIIVTAVFVYPQNVPFREFESLRIGAYQLLDASGKAVLSGERTDLSPVADGKAEIAIPMEEPAPDGCKLVITSFIGESKGDQPLSVNGTWECTLSH